MKPIFDLFISLFRVALFTYGGGYSMIMMIEREVCERRQWMNRSQFLDSLSIAQSAPGPISINISILIGYKRQGVAGAIVGFLATAMPSFLIFVLFAISFNALGDDPVVDKIFKGLRPTVVALVLSPFLGFMKSIERREYLYVVIVALLVTLGVPSILFIIIGVVWGVCLVKVKNRRKLL